MKKYYVEIWDNEGAYTNPYIIQSKWYDTKEEALEFAKCLDYVDNTFNTSLMSAEFDEDGEMGDIDFEYNITYNRGTWYGNI